MGCLTKKDSKDSAKDSADMGKLRGEMSFSRPLSVAKPARANMVQSVYDV